MIYVHNRARVLKRCGGEIRPMVRRAAVRRILTGILAGACMAVLGCGSAPPAVVHTADLMPQVLTLGKDIQAARILNTKAQSLVVGLGPLVSPTALAPLHTTLRRQGTVLVRANANAAVLARQAAENAQALVSMEKTTRNARSAAARALADKHVADRRRDAAIQQYQRAWIGGRTKRLIAWIIGLGLLLVVGDFLISAIFGVGFNPLEWIFNLARAAHAPARA